MTRTLLSLLALVPLAPSTAGADEPSTLRIDAGGASVHIDGAAVTASDSVGLSLARGAHTIRVERDGRKTWTARVRVQDGEQLDLRIELGHEQGTLAKVAQWGLGTVGYATILSGFALGISAAAENGADTDRASLADGMVLAGSAVIILARIIHWRTQDTPPQIQLVRSSRTR